MRWRAIGIGILLLPLLGGMALYAAAPYLLARIATGQLGRVGVVVESLAIGWPGPSGVDARDIRLRRTGTHVAVDRIRVRYRLGDLFDGRVETVEVGPAEVRIAGGGGGVPPVPFFRPPERWPVGRLVVEGIGVFQGDADEPRCEPGVGVRPEAARARGAQMR